MALRGSRGGRTNRGGSVRGNDGQNWRQGKRGTGERKTKQDVEQHQIIETLEDKNNYYCWKRVIKSKPTLKKNLLTIKKFWDDAFNILDGKDQELKIRLPQDLESTDLFGREHIAIIMEIQSHHVGSKDYIDLMHSFLRVATHDAFIHCISVDTAVGGIYRFISGTNGTRACLFFQHLCSSIIGFLRCESNLELIDELLIQISRALKEIFRREQKVPFNKDLPVILEMIEDIMEKSSISKQSLTYQIVNQAIVELRGVVNRALRTLRVGGNSQSSPGYTKVITSTYPRSNIGPQNHHDNDKLDISEISILPTLEEIVNEYPDFLPSTNPQMPHFLEERSLRHLDTHFRLLRHDIFGDFKETLGGLISAVQKDPTFLERSRLSLNSQIRILVYPNARISYLSFDHKRELELQITFPHPPAVRNKNLSQKVKWWRDSKRLEKGTFICLFCCKGTESPLLFLTVTEKSTEKGAYTLISNDYLATIKARLVSENQEEIEKLTNMYMANIGNQVLLEIPSLILATFVPILKRLQEMYKANHLSFRQWILPEISNADFSPSYIPPAVYARGPQFSYSLKSILKNPVSNDILVKPLTSMGDEELIEKIVTNTLLDRGQAEALVWALCQEFVQVQGPPGTGKSFLGVKLMQVLLDTPDKHNLGPVIVVCYTNHALDQFLEHLLDVGVQKIIRVGGQSKVEKLKGRNLRVVAKAGVSTRSENYILHMAYNAMERQEEPIGRCFRELRNIRNELTWTNIKNLLEQKHPKIYKQFESSYWDGYESYNLSYFDLWLQEEEINLREHQENRSTTITQLLELASENVYSISKKEKKILKEFWISELLEELVDKLYEGIADFKIAKQVRTNIHREVDRRVLQDAEVIGITTSGLAGNIEVLQHVNAKVLVCEEAGEIIEAHFLTTLLPSVEHIISIGDHMQLRPTINNFSLSLENPQGMQYQLDRSLFERLSIGETGIQKFPVTQLQIQRRMRPEISNLIKELYPNLIDDESVENLPDVIGLRNNIFFFDHKNLEGDSNQGGSIKRSHINLWEVDMTHALVRHLVLQGSYRSTDIAVLTPYSGQLQRLRSKFQNEFEVVLSDRDQDLLVEDGFIDDDNEQKNTLDKKSAEGKPVMKKISDLIRIATVDNFQGEEAKVVIVSLVRSNKEKKVGFLKTKNRINVLLSRAKQGLYLIGNSETYSKIPMWTRVIGTLKSQNSFGTSFNLCCPRHKSTVIQVQSPADFEKHSPEGGCKLICELRLDCGHQCVSRCHSEAMHKIFKCQKPCERLYSPCQHTCQKSCGEKCGVCRFKLKEYSLPCGHSKKDIFCYETLAPEKINCIARVQKQSPRCGHAVTIACSQDVSLPSYRCNYPCKELLPCGHQCTGTCGGCTSNELSIEHKKCTIICGRPLSNCNHRCEKPCHDGIDCGVCSKPCEVKCGHSKCSLSCYMTCAPCVEPCEWESCEHVQESCHLPCAAPCTRMPCRRRCTKLLTSCGHQCPSLCGETCPEEYCQTCSSKKDARVDLILFKNYDEVNLDEDPIIVIGCGHFFTAESLDGMIGMSEVYETDKFGNFIKLKESSELSGPIPKCPDCKSCIRQYSTKRYNRVINRAIIDEISRKFLISGQTSLQELERDVDNLEKEIDKNRSNIEEILHTFSPVENINSAILIAIAQLKLLIGLHKKPQEKMVQRIKKFQREFAEENKPAKKLHDASLKAIREKDLTKRFLNLTLEDPRSIPSRDRRITIGAKVLELNLLRATLINKIQLFKAIKESQFFDQISIDLPKFGLFFQDCQILFNACREDNLPRLAVQCTIYFGQIASHYQSFRYGTDTTEEKTNVLNLAKELLILGEELCMQPFKGSSDLATAIEKTLKILGRERYEEVTKEELEGIKLAMITGPNGIATHSGHWYKCILGHPFAIGECGMPMELARCPECGSSIGGQNHQAVTGVTRAEEMES